MFQRCQTTPVHARRVRYHHLPCHNTIIQQTIQESWDDKPVDNEYWLANDIRHE